MAKFGATLRILVGLYGGSALVAWETTDGDLLWVGATLLAAFAVDYTMELGA